MQPIYQDSTKTEQEARHRYNFPEFIMMENAAAALESHLTDYLNGISETVPAVLILCGSGNNGADGLALARRISGKIDCAAVILKEPGTAEAKQQFKMAAACGVTFFTAEDAADVLKNEKWNVIVDCIYGTGFHGQVNDRLCEVISAANKSDAYRIACDIPSGIDKAGIIETKDEEGQPLAFKADETVTMGALKSALYSDAAKDFTGEVSVAALGISSELFSSCIEPEIFLLEQEDIVLPFRDKKSVHKGNFGHAAVILGEKPGAGIIAAAAALKAGAGYSSVVTGWSENVQNFALSPELMHGENLPSNTSAMLFGSGAGRNFNSDRMVQLFSCLPELIGNTKDKAAVLDADVFYFPQLKMLLEELNRSGFKVILTPHPKELQQILKACTASDWDQEYVVQNRLELTKMLGSVYENLVFVSKGANTYITHGQELFICNTGAPSLAKAGSGDVLAGLCTGLLAQNYSAFEAAKAAVWLHAMASNQFFFDFSLTPLELIKKI